MATNDAALLDAVAISMQITIDSHLLGRVNMLCNLITFLCAWFLHNFPFRVILPSYYIYRHLQGGSINFFWFFVVFL